MEIRTPDLLRPRQARYQAALRPDNFGVHSIASCRIDLIDGTVGSQSVLNIIRIQELLTGIYTHRSIFGTIPRRYCESGA